MTETIGLYTCIKNEHDFINQFIEYHYKLGVDHFYFLIDTSTHPFSE